MDHSNCGRIDRRSMLADCGMGLFGVAMGASLMDDGISRGAEPSLPHLAATAELAAKAKNVIWLFMLGGTSHMESFDPKPALNKFAGKTIDESPFRSAILDSPFYRKNVIDFAGTPRALMGSLYPLQQTYRKRGQAGIEICDWWPEVGSCVDDLAIVRSMCTRTWSAAASS